MASRLAEWTIIACFPAGIFLLLGVLELPSFIDPCHAWGNGSGDDADPTVASNCIGRTSTLETKAQAATRLLFFQGTTLVGSVLGLVGGARGRRVLVGVGAGLLAAISLPLIPRYICVFPLASAALFAVGLWLNRPPAREALRRA